MCATYSCPIPSTSQGTWTPPWLTAVVSSTGVFNRRSQWPHLRPSPSQGQTVPGRCNVALPHTSRLPSEMLRYRHVHCAQERISERPLPCVLFCATPLLSGRGGGRGQGCIGRGGAPCVTFRLVVAPLRGPGRSPPPPSRARSRCPATVPLTPSASLNGICNRQYPPPTALATSSNRLSNRLRGCCFRRGAIHSLCAEVPGNTMQSNVQLGCQGLLLSVQAKPKLLLFGGGGGGAAAGMHWKGGGSPVGVCGGVRVGVWGWTGGLLG